jgi:hypothetical protein
VTSKKDSIKGLGHHKPRDQVTRLFSCNDVCNRRLQVGSLDFFADPFTRADVIMLGMILHDWGAANKRLLMGKVCCGPLTKL